MSMDDAFVRQGIVGALQAGLRISQVPKTNLMRISYVGLDPKLSADIVNRVIADYIRTATSRASNPPRRCRNGLSSQLDELKQQVEASQEKMLDLQSNSAFWASTPPIIRSRPRWTTWPKPPAWPS